jgi:predicted transposase/invertase (TIGR01784 family)
VEFVDPKNDIAFRKIFGNENKKVILISFLNAVLDLEGDLRITYVELMNPYQLPIIQGLKSSIVDLKAMDGKGHSYVIEMQVAEPDGLEKRLLYYLSKDYVNQIDSGEQYAELKPVIFIGIFNFRFTANKLAVSHHAVCNVESGERIIKDMDFFFIELPKFTKKPEELLTIMEKWLYFIKEARNLDVMPTDLGDEGLKQAYHDAAKFTWTKEELNAYDYAAMREQDERGIKALAVRRAEQKAMEKGLEKGMEKGMEKGNDEGQGQIVRFQASLGKTVEEISANTGLSLERVGQLLGPI